MESKRKIAYLVSQYPAISHTFILREVLQLRGLGWNLEIASINDPDRPDNDLTQEERREKTQTFYVKQAGFLGAFSACFRAIFTHPLGFLNGLGCVMKLAKWDIARFCYHLFYFAEALLVGSWMERKGISHLHVHFANPASTVGLIASKIYPITFSLTVHGPDEFYDVPGNSLKEKILGASFVCCISNYAKSQLMRLSDPVHWGKLEVSPLGVDPEVFAPADSQKGSEDHSLLCIGRLAPSKGQHILIDAISLLVGRGYKVSLELIGDGPDRKSLEKAVQDKGVADSIRFHGAVNQDGIKQYLTKAEVFVLPSFAEGVPVVLMEAMSMGIPCVSTAINGIPELIQTDVEGLLVPPADAEQLARAISALIEDSALRERLGRAGRQKILEKYCISTNMNGLDQIFKKRVS